MSQPRNDQLKTKIFGIDQYRAIVRTFRNQLEGLSPHQKKLLRNGRHYKFYHDLEPCIGKPGEEGQHCFKESLHKGCSEDYLQFKTCLENRRNGKECNSSLGEYFICIDGSIKQILLSSTLSY